MNNRNSLGAWLAYVEKHSHDFTIQYPPRREYFMQNYRGAVAPRIVHDRPTELDPVLLYLHVPFCEAKCYYCNFAVDLSCDERVQTEYVDALLREIEMRADSLTGRRVLGVDIGGGTPTRLPTVQLTRLIGRVQQFIDYSAHPFLVSIESTPSIAAHEPEKFVALRACGVARVSIGVQSFNAQTLAQVNRSRQIEQTKVAMANLRAAGFLRTNLDMIFALPGQSLGSWKQDLDHVIALEPDSVTTYDCLYRGKGRTLTQRMPFPPCAEAYGEMYDLAYDTLTRAGWHATYGSVNFSKAPNETGTSAYFEGRLLDGLPYVGFGNYATSLTKNTWTFNAYKARDYVTRVFECRNPVEFHYDLPTFETQAKYALGSLNFGFIDLERFERRFGLELSAAYAPELDYALSAGWLERKSTHWQIAAGQFQKIHLIRSLFYPNSARNWLMKQ